MASGVLDLNLSLFAQSWTLTAESRKLAAVKASKKLSFCRNRLLQSFAVSGDFMDGKKRRKPGNPMHGVTETCFLSGYHGSPSSWTSTFLSLCKVSTFALYFSWHLRCSLQQLAASRSDTHQNTNGEGLDEAEGFNSRIQATWGLEIGCNDTSHGRIDDESSNGMDVDGHTVSEEISPATQGNGRNEVQPVNRWRLEEGCNVNEGLDDQRRTRYEASNSGGATSIGEPIFVGVKEPLYEVLELNLKGCITKKEISRRQLLKASGLRLRDIRSVDPSLWITNSVPALLVRDHAILLNMGSLRAIATCESVLVFDHRSIGAQYFLRILRQRLTCENSGNLAMPFELETVEAALISRTQQLEQTLMQIEPQVVSLLEKILPNRLTADLLEELRISKQALVELSAKAGSLRQMLLELLEDPHEIRRMTIIGRRCHVRKENGTTECIIPSDKQAAEEEEEEIEMLLENYLQRCESCHGQAQKLLDSAKEMEDSISVNLSARRLEVSRLELLLQVGTFCSALGALIAGIFGMNLRSYLEEHVYAFWLTTAGIILGGFALFFLMYTYLKKRRIL